MQPTLYTQAPDESEEIRQNKNNNNNKCKEKPLENYKSKKSQRRGIEYR